MIRPEPRAPTRDDLAKQVSWLPWGTFRGSGAKTANEVRDIAKGMANEGATPHEIHDETAKFAGPEETGMMQNPAQQWGYELSDKNAMLTPQALDWMKAKFSKGYGGDTPEVGLDRLLSHESLYGRVPDLRKVKTTLSQPEADETGYVAQGAYDAPDTLHGAGTEMGRIEAHGAPGVDPNSTDQGSLRYMLAHEIQHPIQHKLQLPVGGDQRDDSMQMFFNDKMQPHANQLRIKYETDREKAAMDYAQAMGGGEDMLRKGREEWQKAFPEKNLLISQSHYVGGAPGNSKIGLASKQPLQPFGQYKSLVGEQSADASANRLGWGTEQRRANPMFEARGLGSLSPALQMIKWGPGDFEAPDPLWAAINTAGEALMAEHITMVKAKPVEHKVGDTKKAINEANALAGHLARSPGEMARNSAFSTWDAKRRKSFADAGHPEWAGQRDWNSSGEDYKPPMAAGDIPLDVLKGGVSGLTALPEQTVGMLGDLPDMRYDLARYMNKKLSGMPGGNATFNRVIDATQKYDPLHYLPHTEQVAGAVTDPLLEAMGPTAQDWGRYQPQSPWGGASNLAANAVDPLAAGGKAGRVAANVFRKVR